MTTKTYCDECKKEIKKDDPDLQYEYTSNMENWILSLSATGKRAKNNLCLACFKKLVTKLTKKNLKDDC